MALKLLLAADCTPRTRTLFEGLVVPEGIELELVQVASEWVGSRFVPGPTLRHHRMLHEGAYDAGEYSTINYLNGFERGLPFTALPVFPRRDFRLRDIWVHEDSAHVQPAQLNGRRIGIQLWANSANLWQRAICQHFYGLDLASVDWVCNDPEEVAGYTPPDWVRRGLRPRDRSLEQMLATGELDALMLPIEPVLPGGERPPFRRLFADWASAEQEFFHATGLYPPMHAIAVRNTLLEADPWVAGALFAAFRKAFDTWAAAEAAAVRASPIWPGLSWAQQTAILGPQPYPSGLEANRRVLEAAVGYALEQGIVNRRIAVEELFTWRGRPVVNEVD